MNFYGDRLYGVKEQGAIYIPLKPICEAMGIDHDSQRHRINRDPVLAKGAVVMTVPFGAGGQQMMFCLSLNRINFWLATIQPERIKNEPARERAMLYREECADVLFVYFTTGKLPQNSHVTVSLLHADLFDQPEPVTETPQLDFVAIVDRLDAMDRKLDLLIGKDDEPHIAAAVRNEMRDQLRDLREQIMPPLDRIDSRTSAIQIDFWRHYKINPDDPPRKPDPPKYDNPHGTESGLPKLVQPRKPKDNDKKE